MLNLSERSVQVGETERTREIDRIHDHKGLRTSAFTWKPGTRDFADRTETGEMQDVLSQEQTIFVEGGFAADQDFDGVFKRTPCGNARCSEQEAKDNERVFDAARY
jgi:hypothetical protein